MPSDPQGVESEDESVRLPDNRKRTDQRANRMRYYHVTEREDAAPILATGFLGGWGDVGFGVYFHGTLERALDYASKGGWDGRLTDPVVIEIRDSRLVRVEPHADWEASQYEDMFWFELNEADEDQEEELFKPAFMRVLENPECVEGLGETYTPSTPTIRTR
jgi:hypothetical protein